MKKLVLLVMILVLSVMAVSAQDSIAPGDVITGEISESSLEVTYQADVTEGVPVVFAVTGIDAFDDGFSDPKLVLNAPTGETVSDTDEMFQIHGTFGQEYLVFVPNATATYSITVGQTEFGDSVGEFTLEMIEVPVVALDEVYSGDVTTEGDYDFYFINSDSDFIVSYEIDETEYVPEILLNTHDLEEGLEPVAYMGGEVFTRGAFGIFPAGEAFIISVGEPNGFFSFFFDEITTNYSIQISAAG